MSQQYYSAYCSKKCKKAPNTGCRNVHRLWDVRLFTYEYNSSIDKISGWFSSIFFLRCIDGWGDAADCSRDDPSGPDICPPRWQAHPSRGRKVHGSRSLVQTRANRQRGGRHLWHGLQLHPGMLSPEQSCQDTSRAVICSIESPICIQSTFEMQAYSKSLLRYFWGVRCV